MVEIVKNIKDANAITHGGKFHTDEIMATVILSKVFPELKVLRTFNIPYKLDGNIIVYDIGNGKFDHHQKGGNGTRKNDIPYASCGLIWREFGMEIVKDSPNPIEVFKMMDREICQPIDAGDNGIAIGGNYAPLTIQGMITSLYPNWDSTESEDEAFLKAVEFCSFVFDKMLESCISKVRATCLVEEAIEASKDQIIVLDKFMPWMDALFRSENSKAKEALFIVFPSIRGGFNWQVLPIDYCGKDARKPVPSSWRGLQGQELQKETGIDDANFCHNTGFLGSNSTLEGAIKMAKLAIEA